MRPGERPRVDTRTREERTAPCPEPGQPVAELDARYSDAKATAADWSAGGRPPEGRRDLLAVDRTTRRPPARHSADRRVARTARCTSAPAPRSARRRTSASNQEVVLTTGANALSEGYDLVIEGEAVRVTDETRLRALAAAYVEKYGADWDVRGPRRRLHQPRAAPPWCSGWRRARHSASARATRSARPAGSSRSEVQCNPCNSVKSVNRRNQ